MRILLILCAWVALILVMTTSANAKGGLPVWDPPGSYPVGFDWIQLNSGEWLKGDLKVLYDHSLEFDSDELDLLHFDWEDVYQVICHQVRSVRIEGPDARSVAIFKVGGKADEIVGKLHIKGNKVIVDTGVGVMEFDRSNLVSIASGTKRELDLWSATITLSLDLIKGNTDQVNYSSYADAKRRTSFSRFYIDYRGIYSSTSGVVTSNNQRAGSYYDIFSTSRFFWRPFLANYYRDTFANIDSRASIGTGFGYHLIDTPETEWLVSPGIAYERTRYDSVEDNEDNSASTPAFIFSTEYDTELTEKTDFSLKYKFSLVNKESGYYSHNVTAVLTIELTGRLDLDFSGVWDRIQNPEPDADGNLPEKDDFYIFSGLSFEL